MDRIKIPALIVTCLLVFASLIIPAQANPESLNKVLFQFERSITRQNKASLIVSQSTPREEVTTGEESEGSTNVTELSFEELSHYSLPKVEATERASNQIEIKRIVHAAGPSNQSALFQFERLIAKSEVQDLPNFQANLLKPAEEIVRPITREFKRQVEAEKKNIFSSFNLLLILACLGLVSLFFISKFILTEKELRSDHEFDKIK